MKKYLDLELWDHKHHKEHDCIFNSTRQASQTGEISIYRPSAEWASSKFVLRISIHIRRGYVY